jgi:LuxR family transcriptional regulator
VNAWSADLLNDLESLTRVSEIFERIAQGARQLGFENCAYGLRKPLPFTNPRVSMLNTYDPRWQARYDDAGYLQTDPSVLQGCRSHAPMVWSDALFSRTPRLWDEARSFGLRVGWAQSCFDADGKVGLLSLSRSHEAMSRAEIVDKEPMLRWFVSVAHTALSGVLAGSASVATRLTAREVEVMKWTADGKTARDVGAILGVSENTANFHVKNANRKLGANSKAAAVARAAALGLLR